MQPEEHSISQIVHGTRARFQKHCVAVERISGSRIFVNVVNLCALIDAGPRFFRSEVLLRTLQATQNGPLFFLAPSISETRIIFTRLNCLQPPPLTPLKRLLQFDDPQIETGNVEVTSTVGSSSALTTGDSFTVEFTGVYGDVPLLIARPASRATVTTTTQGDAPFRKEIQAFSCSADSVGDLKVTWRGLDNVTVGAEDDLDSFEAAISAGLTNITVAGSETGTICSGEMVYVTFQEVRSSSTTWSTTVRVSELMILGRPSAVYIRCGYNSALTF